MIRKEKKILIQLSMEKEKLRKIGLCFITGCFIKLFKGATKLYFMHHLRVVSILFSTGLFKFAFSTYLLVTLGFRLSCFCIFGFNFYFCSMFWIQMSSNRLNNIVLSVNIINYVPFNFVFTLFKRPVKCKNCVIKTCF